ncbi:MAG: mannose-1-phosphate guanylyltransferase/mannose-6-phosphate isomerase [Rickettsiales bacterium]|nr:mannose-1-phosphate guanylyltransferase/mannose-6-phosphate isomerase [Rickettsiales bacterium]
MKEKIYPVIMCGGYGTRLWPSSRTSYPKQFMRINSKEPLFIKTIKRFLTKDFYDVTLIGNYEHRFLLKNFLDGYKIKYRSIILEPYSKNTLISAILSVLEIKDLDKNAKILLVPADQIIKDNKKLVDNILKSRCIVDKGFINTFGIKPSHPSTQFGYIKPRKKKITKHSSLIESFLEKPNQEKAHILFKSRSYFWNSGIFFFSAESFLRETKTYASKTYKKVQEVFLNKKNTFEFISFPEKKFKLLPNKSIDKGLMEKTENGAVTFTNIDWSDIGSWQGVWECSKKDKQNNYSNHKNLTLKNVKNSLFWSSNPDKKIVGINIDNLIIVEEDDTTLIMNKNKYDNELKEIVKKLKKKNDPSTDVHKHVFRPWGEFKNIHTDQGFQIKILIIYPNNKISLQYHNKRSEHWVVVEGKATVTKGNKTFILNTNQSTFIDVKEIHRLENKTSQVLKLVEIQTGKYLGEDDIVRIEDKYGRKKR